MIKCYCDKCGVEVKKLFKIKVPLENKGNGIFTAIDIAVCPKCKKGARSAYRAIDGDAL